MEDQLNRPGGFETTPGRSRPLLIQARVDLCPIKESAKILGKKWYLVIVHRLLDRPRGFNDLKEAVGDISAKILSQALQDMAQKGIVERRVSSESPVRVEYSLTEQGRDLSGVLKELYDWGKKWALCADNRTGATTPSMREDTSSRSRFPGEAPSHPAA